MSSSRKVHYSLHEPYSLPLKFKGEDGGCEMQRKLSWLLRPISIHDIDEEKFPLSYHTRPQPQPRAQWRRNK